MTGQPAILSLGEVLWDLFPEGPRFGGAPANFACHAATLGGAVSMGSAVGNDPRGNDAMAILRGFGVDVRAVQVTADAPTGTVAVNVDVHGKPTYTIEENAAWDRIAWSPELKAELKACDAVYFGTLGQRGSVSRNTIRQSLEVAIAQRIPRILDVNLRAPFFDVAMIRESVALASVLKLSDEELKPVAAACGIGLSDHPAGTLHALREGHGLDLIVMTRGADGALLLSPTEMIDQAGISTEVRDTVGAGDSFTAALVVGLLRGEALADLARKACETAAAVCAQPGAVPELPESTRHPHFNNR